jgi:hypothetical protein
MKIYKKVAPFGELLRIPNCADVVKLAIQYDRPTVWYIHDDFQSEKCFYWTWTAMEYDGWYVDTLFHDELVWHLIEK